MKNLKTIIVMLSLVTLTACNDILDKEPLDTFTNGNFWTSESNVRGYAFAFYNDFLGYGNGNTLGDFYFKTLSDDQVGNGFSNFTPVQVPASDTYWRDRWIMVRRANALLENVHRVPMSEAAIAHWEAVGKLMRAWTYYKLVRNYGDVPWVETVLDITDEGVLYGKRENRDGIMDKVLEDLQAVDKLYDNKINEINRAIGNAIKSEICLYEGTFRKYRSAPDAAGAQRFLQASKSASEFVMGKGYTLSPSYRALYNSRELNGNPEVIFYKEYITGVMVHSTIAYITSTTQISGLSKNAFDAYLFKDGKPLALTAENKSDEAEVISAGEGKIMKIKDLLAVRDGRLSETIDTLLCYVRQDVVGTTSSSGYRIIKYDNPTLPMPERSMTSANQTDAPLFWLAVIYLNYAEAAAELGDITQTDLDNTVNKLRDRAGLPHLSTNVGFHDPANNENVSDLIWEIRRERRCELMFDNNFRFWDLARWHQLEKLDSEKHPDILLGANIKADVTTTIDKIGDYIDGTKGGNKRIYNAKYDLSPIPSGQITLNPQLAPNNPGW
ncbi:hypothetical protein FACS1894207_2430 [Bacteroidia bacterium]|nr:hypothetical protein FACS1894207_2430 [Bacteroidia bacterium]GHV30576.1 hypothetical protein FACS1894177_03390 [Bacteroidia bacterium]